MHSISRIMCHPCSFFSFFRLSILRRKKTVAHHPYQQLSRVRRRKLDNTKIGHFGLIETWHEFDCWYDRVFADSSGPPLEALSPPWKRLMRHDAGAGGWYQPSPMGNPWLFPQSSEKIKKSSWWTSPDRVVTWLTLWTFSRPYRKNTKSII